MDIEHITEVTKDIDHIQHVGKANPYHDERGRFTSANGGSAGGATFSASGAAKQINDISTALNNRGGDEKNDWKKVRDILQSAPVGTIMTQTGDRGSQTQHEKTGEDEWTSTGSYRYTSDSKTMSMSWVGNGYKPSVSFNTRETAPSTKDVADSQVRAVNGQLNQWLRGAEAKKSYDTIEHVEKANPYHGADGRFTTASASGGGAASAGGGFKPQTHNIGGTGSKYGDKNLRIQILQDMDNAPVGTKMQIKTRSITGPRDARQYAYTKVDAAGIGSSDRGIWRGSDGKEVTGLTISNQRIKTTMNMYNRTGSVTIGKSEIDTIEHTGK